MKLAFLLNIYIVMIKVWMNFIDFDFFIIYDVDVSFCFTLNNVGPFPLVVPQSPLEVLYAILNLQLLGWLVLPIWHMLVIPHNSTIIPTFNVYHSQPSSNEYPHVLIVRNQYTHMPLQNPMYLNGLKHPINTHNLC